MLNLCLLFRYSFKIKVSEIVQNRKLIVVNKQLIIHIRKITDHCSHKFVQLYLFVLKSICKQTHQTNTGVCIGKQNSGRENHKKRL